MLRLSKLADYGTMVMVYLAHETHQVVNARDIAQHTHLSVSTVSKLLKSLTKAGLLISVRGVHGGYQLQHKPADISVADIIYVFEKRQGFTECRTDKTCHLQSVCTIQGNWNIIADAIDTALRNVTLEMLAQPRNYTHGIPQASQNLGALSFTQDDLAYEKHQVKDTRETL